MIPGPAQCHPNSSAPPMLKQLTGLFNTKKEKKSLPFNGSESYWETRYASGGNSGVGSYKKFAAFKAQVINEFVRDNQINSVIDFGCGDGSQLMLAEYPQYLGLDVSATVLAQCEERYHNDTGKQFKLMSESAGESAELALSLDVIYHLVEDKVFDQYMHNLFNAASRFVVVYASNFEAPDQPDGEHVKHREFTRWIEQRQPAWQLLEHIPNKYPYKGNYKTGSFADFYIFSKTLNASSTQAGH